MGKIISTLAVILIVMLVIKSMTGAPTTEDTYIDFIITRGQGVNAISQNLKDSDIIKSKFAFEIYVWAKGVQGNIQAGSYRISRSNRLGQLVKILTQGSGPMEGRVTVIEGWSNKTIAEYLGQQGFEIDKFYDDASTVGAWQVNYPILSNIPADSSLEGFLYPDTYAVTVDKNTEKLIGKMLDNFTLKISDGLEGFSFLDEEFKLYDVIILASIVEKEVASFDDRQMVADIFLRRLAEGIGLQADSTINYLTNSGRARSTAKDLEIDSPYNTYKYRGLPPGPIGNPSIDSIKAVVNSKANEFYYFLTDENGKVYYAIDFAGHQRNRADYL
jgi:UPF0755 protein